MKRPDRAKAVQAAYDRTVAAGSARALLARDITVELPEFPQRRRGGLLRPAIDMSKEAGRRLWQRVDAKLDFRHQECEGVIDLRDRRFMLDYGSYARLSVDGREWSGLSGRARSTLPPEMTHFPSPLWLIDILAGVERAEEIGAEDVRGTRCTNVTAVVDLARASEAIPGGLAVPSRERFEELHALPVDVWFDDAHIRRVSFAEPTQRHTIELWDLGTPLDGLDWSHLPTFRTPGEPGDLSA